MKNKSSASSGGHGGKRRGAGRKKGGRARASAQLKEHVVKLMESGEEMPLDFLLRVMRSPEPVPGPKEEAIVFIARYKRWDEDRLEAAKHAAPYCHAKLASVEHTGKDGKPIQHEIVVTFGEEK